MVTSEPFLAEEVAQNLSLYLQVQKCLFKNLFFSLFSFKEIFRAGQLKSPQVQAHNELRLVNASLSSLLVFSF